MAGAQWRLLFVKLLHKSDLEFKLKTPGGDYRSFLHSIPSDARLTYLSQGKIPATLYTDQGGRVCAHSEVELQIKFRDGINSDRCSFELPPLHGNFEYDLDVKMEYCWRGGRLHLRATMAYPIYADIEQNPTPWRLLGEKLVVSRDVRLRMLKLPQEDMTEFYSSIPAEVLQRCLMKNVGLKVGIWVGELECVAGMLKASESVQMDVTFLGIEITCRRAFEKHPAFYSVESIVQVFYQWAYGTLYVAIVPNMFHLPQASGEKFSLF